MKSFITLFIFIVIFTGCKQKILSGKDLENKLIETMGNYLDSTLKPGVHATVKDIIYYPEASKKLYRCEFHVMMHYGNKDTTGIVAGTITNDFKTVSRTQ